MKILKEIKLILWCALWSVILCGVMTCILVPRDVILERLLNVILPAGGFGTVLFYAIFKFTE